MSKKLALMLLLYALGNTKVNKTLSWPTRIFSSSRGNKMYTNGHVGGSGGGTVTCRIEGTMFHLMEEGAVASTLEGTKTAVCR